MEEPTRSADFFPRAGLPENPREVIGRKLLCNNEDEGFELGGLIEGYEIHGEFWPAQE